jgi:pyrroloquinoline-quinone synthase
MDTSTRALERALRDQRLLEHPFYRRWEAGQLSENELRDYAEQYRFFERMLPEFLAELAERLPAGAARAAIEANLADEVGPPSHVEIFEDFAAHYGADAAAAGEAVMALQRAYRRGLDDGPVAAVAGLLAYEAQGADIARTKSVGLREHYGATEDATRFWQLHGELEAHHASWSLDALASLDGDPELIEAAAARVAGAWWAFLDEREAFAAS